MIRDFALRERRQGVSAQDASNLLRRAPLKHKNAARLEGVDSAQGGKGGKHPHPCERVCFAVGGGCRFGIGAPKSIPALCVRTGPRKEAQAHMSEVMTERWSSSSGDGERPATLMLVEPDCGASASAKRDYDVGDGDGDYGCDDDDEEEEEVQRSPNLSGQELDTSINVQRRLDMSLTPRRTSQ